MKRTIPWNIAFVLAACAPVGAQETPEPFLIVTGGGEARNTLNKSVPGTLDLRGGSSRAEREDRGGGRWSR